MWKFHLIYLNDEKSESIFSISGIRKGYFLSLYLLNKVWEGGVLNCVKVKENTEIERFEIKN